MIYPIRNIVAGIESLDEADPLLEPAAEAARRTAATLHLVHTYELPTLAWEGFTPIAALDSELIEEYATSLRKRLEGWAREAGWRRTVCEVVPAPPAAAILDYAERVSADLVIVGATRHRRLVRLILGTTAQRVLRQSTVPVLVVRGTPPHHLARVLLATDLSDFSAGVHEVGLDVLESLFSGDTPQLRSLHVAYTGEDVILPEHSALLEKAAREKLTGFLQQRRPRALPMESAVRCGDPATVIVQESSDWNADLLILGKHRDSTAMRWLLGSVVEGAARDSASSILVIPSPMEEERTLPVTWADSHPTTPPPQ